MVDILHPGPFPDVPSIYGCSLGKLFNNLFELTPRDYVLKLLEVPGTMDTYKTASKDPRTTKPDAKGADLLVGLGLAQRAVWGSESSKSGVEGIILTKFGEDLREPIFKSLEELKTK